MLRKARLRVSPFPYALLFAGSLFASSEGMFWRDLPYGSERQFNPFSVITNEGFDILQMEGHGNGLDTLFRPSDARRLGSALAHPLDAIDQAGWANFAGTEIVPTSLRPSRAAWIPNWQLHVVGGGFTNARLEDWYRAQGCESPFLPALFTSYTGHLLNETIEIRGMAPGAPTDPVADIYIFDAAGIALFHVPVVRTFFTSTVQLMDWPLQPSLGIDGRTLENAGQYYALKVALPRIDDWKFFYHFGLGNIGGVSRRVGRADAISLGVGAYARRIDAVDQTTNDVEMAPKVGLFWDRENSLLGSVFWNGQSVNRFSLQLYPGAMPIVPLGGWISLDEDGCPSGGITTVFGFGAGRSRP